MVAGPGQAPHEEGRASGAEGAAGAHRQAPQGAARGAPPPRARADRGLTASFPPLPERPGWLALLLERGRQHAGLLATVPAALAKGPALFLHELLERVLLLLDGNIDGRVGILAVDA